MGCLGALSSDLKHFKALTMGKPLILGRRTFESLQRPLPGREIIVVTRDPRFSPAGVRIAHSPLEALAVARRLARALAVDEIMVGGGAEIFRALMDETQRIELTEIALEPKGDAYFPQPRHGSMARNQARNPAARRKGRGGLRLCHPGPPIDLTRRRPLRGNICCSRHAGKLYSGADAKARPRARREARLWRSKIAMSECSAAW